MTSMNRNQIEKFASLYATQENIPEKNITTASKIIADGLVPLTYENLVALRDTSPHEEIRSAATKGMKKRIDILANLIEVAGSRGYDLADTMRWLGVEEDVDTQILIDRAVEYATTDATMTLDPARVAL